MIFSTPELAALNSISGGRDLPGIRLAVPGFDADKELWASVNESLKNKGIIDETGHLTTMGVVPVRVVELYRTAGTHAYIGRGRVSIDEDGSLTILSPQGDDWQVIRAQKAVLMVCLLKRFPFLCGKSSPSEHPGAWRPVSYDDWVDSVSEYGPENVLVANSVRIGETPTDLMAYGLSQGKGFEYNMSQARGRRTSVRDMRVTVARLIGLERGDDNV